MDKEFHYFDDLDLGRNHWKFNEAEELRQKLLEATLELESMKNENAELFNLLKIAGQERDAAKAELQKLKNYKLEVPSTSSPIPTHLQNVLAEIQTQSLFMLPPAASSITESNSFSHVSPLVEDSFFDAVNVVESNNLGHILDQHLVQVQDFNFNYSATTPALVSLEKPTSESDPANAVIDFLAKGRALPQKGKLLQAVIDAGPLLQTILLAGPLPTWRNPPLLRNIKDWDSDNLGIHQLNSFANSLQKTKLVSSHCSNAAPPTFSASMVNFAGHPSGSLNI